MSSEKEHLRGRAQHPTATSLFWQDLTFSHESMKRICCSAKIKQFEQMQTFISSDLVA